jgi:hypothetical protein
MQRAAGAFRNRPRHVPLRVAGNGRCLRTQIRGSGVTIFVRTGTRGLLQPYSNSCFSPQRSVARPDTPRPDNRTERGSFPERLALVQRPSMPRIRHLARTQLRNRRFGLEVGRSRGHVEGNNSGPLWQGRRNDRPTLRCRITYQPLWRSGSSWSWVPLSYVPAQAAADRLETIRRAFNGEHTC